MAKTPQLLMPAAPCLQDVMRRCLDPNPSNRPTFHALLKSLGEQLRPFRRKQVVSDMTPSAAASAGPQSSPQFLGLDGIPPPIRSSLDILPTRSASLERLCPIQASPLAQMKRLQVPS